MLASVYYNLIKLKITIIINKICILFIKCFKANLCPCHTAYMYIHVCVIAVFDIFLSIGESSSDFYVWRPFDLIDIDLKLICFLKKVLMKSFSFLRTRFSDFQRIVLSRDTLLNRKLQQVQHFRDCRCIILVLIFSMLKKSVEARQDPKIETEKSRNFSDFLCLSLLENIL